MSSFSKVHTNRIWIIHTFWTASTNLPSFKLKNIIQSIGTIPQRRMNEETNFNELRHFIVILPEIICNLSCRALSCLLPTETQTVKQLTMYSLYGDWLCLKVGSVCLLGNCPQNFRIVTDIIANQLENEPTIWATVVHYYCYFVCVLFRHNSLCMWADKIQKKERTSINIVYFN